MMEDLGLSLYIIFVLYDNTIIAIQEQKRRKGYHIYEQFE